MILKHNNIFFIIAGLLLCTSCHHSIDDEDIRKEIFQTEKAFEKMVSEKGVTEAFYFFADEKAVIKRENDMLVKGKENIKNYYAKKNNETLVLNWTPDYIEVSTCGTLAYTYGKYFWKIKNENGEVAEYRGIFHTVWKKQDDNNWRYVWD